MVKSWLCSVRIIPSSTHNLFIVTTYKTYIEPLLQKKTFLIIAGVKPRTSNYMRKTHFGAAKYDIPLDATDTWRTNNAIIASKRRCNVVLTYW